MPVCPNNPQHSGLRANHRYHSILAVRAKLNRLACRFFQEKLDLSSWMASLPEQLPISQAQPPQKKQHQTEKHLKRFRPPPKILHRFLYLELTIRLPFKCGHYLWAGKLGIRSTNVLEGDGTQSGMQHFRSHSEVGVVDQIKEYQTMYSI